MPIREHDGDEDQDGQRNLQEEPVDVEVEPEPGQGNEDDGQVVEATADDRVASSSDEDEGEHRPRETSKERRERARQAKQRDKAELEFQRAELRRLEQRLLQAERGQTVSRVTELDSRISSAESEIAQMDQVYAAAISKQQGADALAAQKYRESAQQKLQQAMWEKQQLIQAANRPAPQTPSYEPLARQFMADNPWYDHNGGDEDSLIVKAIDAAVAKQYNPNDPTYWSELQKRVDARLGKNRQEQDTDTDDNTDTNDEPPPRRKSGPPVGGSTRSSSTTSGATQYRLSPERVQAMKDAGLWEDPKIRLKMAKKYAEYDRINAG